MNHDNTSSTEKFYGKVAIAHAVQAVSINMIKIKACKLNETELRANVINKEVFDVLAQDDMQWLREIPYDVLDEGVRDLLKAYKSNFGKYKKSLTRLTRPV